LQYEVTIVNHGNQPAGGLGFSDTVRPNNAPDQPRLSDALHQVVFHDIPDSNTTLVLGSVQTTWGTVISGNNAGDTSVVVVIGTLPSDSAVTISFQATINDPLPAGVTQITNQGTVTSAELPPVPTDDPTLAGDTDPTVTPINEEPTNVELRLFTATASGNQVTLHWETSAETNNLGFNLWRGRQPEGNYQRVNRALIPSRPGGIEGASYEFVDRSVSAGLWYYKLETISTSSQTDGWHGPVAVEVGHSGRRRTYLPLTMR
jgi:hypothetical protein